MSNQPGPYDPYRPQDPARPEGSGDSPWPVYGQSGNTSGGVGGSGSPWPTYRPDSHAAPTGAPFPASSAPTPQPVYGSTPFQTGPQPPHYPAPGGVSQPLPSRTGPILTIVSGAVIMAILAPIVLVSLILSGVGITDVVENSMRAANGDTITVDETGAVGVVTTSSNATSCTVEGPSGSVVMVEEMEGTVLVARDLTPGPYTVSCEGVDPSDTVVILNGATLAGLVPSATRAFVWASVVGVGGFVVMILGIFWLVKRNRERRALTFRWPPQ